MIERVLSTHIYHPRGEHQGSLLGRHLENPDFGPRQEPGGRRRPLNSYLEPISNTHQPGGGGKYVIGSKLTREDMDNIWLTKELLVWEER